MTTQHYPRSPKVLSGGMAHRDSLIRSGCATRGTSRITTTSRSGSTSNLLDFLQMKGEEFEQRVLQGGTDEDLLRWVQANSRSLSPEDMRQWNARILNAGPKDEAAHQRFEARLAEVAAKRGGSIEALPRPTTWVEIIELDEGRL